MLKKLIEKNINTIQYNTGGGTVCHLSGITILFHGGYKGTESHRHIFSFYVSAKLVFDLIQTEGNGRAILCYGTRKMMVAHYSGV